MGAAWDATGVAFDAATWQHVLRVLKPGGYLLAFGGTRTYHRLIVAIENAGFDFLGTRVWLYASGFPKSKNVALSIDKARGFNPVPRYKPKTAEAKRWVGWGTGLKPCQEIIVLAQKPSDGRHNFSLHDDQSFFYVPKASRWEREAGCEDLPNVRRTDGRVSEHHVPNLRTNTRRNHHPTVKPLKLMRHLVRLVTPPNGVVLDPFMGSGSSGIAAMLEGARFIGFDMSEDYVRIAQARIEYWR